MDARHRRPPARAGAVTWRNTAAGRWPWAWAVAGVGRVQQPWSEKM